MDALRVVSLIGVLVTLAVGWYLKKNYERFFGIDPEAHSETPGQRSYSSTQILSVWLFTLGLFVLMFFVA